MLDQVAVKELQQILMKEYDKKLDLEEVKKIGSRLIQLYQQLLVPKIKIKNHATQKQQPIRRA